MQYCKNYIKDIFGDGLHRFRITYGLTQEVLAKELHIYPKAVSELECKKYAPSASTILLLFSTMSDAEVLLFVHAFRKRIGRERAQRKGRMVMKEIDWNEYVKDPEAIYRLCLENSKLVKIKNEDNSCVMMPDRIWNLFENAYQSLLDKIIKGGDGNSVRRS